MAAKKSSAKTKGKDPVKKTAAKAPPAKPPVPKKETVVVKKKEPSKEEVAKLEEEKKAKAEEAKKKAASEKAAKEKEKAAKKKTKEEKKAKAKELAKTEKEEKKIADKMDKDNLALEKSNNAKTNRVTQMDALEVINTPNEDLNTRCNGVLTVYNNTMAPESNASQEGKDNAVRSLAPMLATILAQPFEVFQVAWKDLREAMLNGEDKGFNGTTVQMNLYDEMGVPLVDEAYIRLINLLTTDEEDEKVGVTSVVAALNTPVAKTNIQSFYG